MALATKCPHCNTIFRVAADQLKLRGGIVRCGSCHEVFDGNAALVEPAAKPTPVIPEVPMEAVAPSAAEPSISDYVHGTPVDFELDFAGDTEPPAQDAIQPEPSAPAVWRSAADNPSAEEPPHAATPSPDELALAAVARAFAAVTAHPASPPAAPLPAVTGEVAAPAESEAALAEEAPEPTGEAPPPAASAANLADEVTPSDSEADLPADEAAAPATEDALPAAESLTPAAALDEQAPEDEPLALEAVDHDAEPETNAEPGAEDKAEPESISRIETASDQAELTPDDGAAATPPDDRIEPSLDTPQEHIVAAALDDAHHFEDLPPADEPPAAEVAVEDISEPSLPDEPWPAASASLDVPAPEDEPWSLSEPEPERDETALHAVAAVNTDAPDDAESLEEEPGISRRERALERARSRMEANEADDERELAAARMRALAGVDENGEDLDHSDLNFVKRVDRSQKYGKAVKLTMAFGIPVLLAGLALQAATTFRDTLAANYPQLKPALTAACQPLGCKIALPTQLDALSIEQGELASMAVNTFSFSTVLRNQSKTPQAWPHIELTLNDNADKPVLRRVFAPREYLPLPAEAEKGFGPRSEQSIKLYFELKELKASGYHIAIFYP